MMRTTENPSNKSSLLFSVIRFFSDEYVPHWIDKWVRTWNGEVRTYGLSLCDLFDPVILKFFEGFLIVYGEYLLDDFGTDAPRNCKMEHEIRHCGKPQAKGWHGLA